MHRGVGLMRLVHGHQNTVSLPIFTNYMGYTIVLIVMNLVEWGLNPEFITPEFLLTCGFNASLPTRFVLKVRKTESCWIWVGSINGCYGQIGAGGRKSKLVTVHRVSWILHFGPILDGLCVLHDCPDGDNSLCVRPDHLWLGTNADNSADKSGKHRSTYGERASWHKLTWNDVKAIRLSNLKLRELATIYGTSISAIAQVKNGINWSHDGPH